MLRGLTTTSTPHTGPTVTAAEAQQWRAWLAAHHDTSTEVWLVIEHRDSTVPSVGYAEAIEQALCFGWIDGLHRKHGPTSSRLRFTPRGPRSRWSRVNRERFARMVATGQMTAAGQAAADRARAAGTWQVLDDAAALVVPDDLHAGLDRDEVAAAHFAAFPPSSRRLILEWIAGARRPETRQRRVDQTVALAARNLRAAHPGVRSTEAHAEGAGGPSSAPRPAAASKR